MSCTDQVDTAIRGAGLRRTLPRALVLGAVRHGGRHLTTNQVIEQLAREHPEAGISSSTVYRTLATLEASGLVDALWGGGETRYEWVSDEPAHHHLVCRDCGKTAELERGALARIESEIRERTGFRPELRHLAIHGRCADCLDAGSPVAAGPTGAAVD